MGEVGRPDPLRLITIFITLSHDIAITGNGRLSFVQLISLNVKDDIVKVVYCILPFALRAVCDHNALYNVSVGEVSCNDYSNQHSRVQRVAEADEGEIHRISKCFR